MSNTLAIATVTATLQQMVINAVISDFPGVNVSIGPPLENPPNSPQVNICLYQISPNKGYQNADLPARDAVTGNWVTQPQLGIDLHYLFTFYGNNQQLQPDRLLGDVLSMLYTQPILSRSLIEATIQLPNYSFLVNSDLANSPENIRLTPQADPREEVAQLWRDYFETIPYTLSLAYTASVVLLDPVETIQPQIAVQTIAAQFFPVSGSAEEAVTEGIPPNYEATAINLDNLNYSANNITGSMIITPAIDESDLMQYRLYWGVNATTKLANTPALAILPKTGSTLVHSIPSFFPVPSGANYVLVYTANYQAEMAYGISNFLIGKASGVKFDGSINTVSRIITGFVAITIVYQGENFITHYNLYWGSSTTQKLSTAPFASLPKTGSNLTYTFPTNSMCPQGAQYILLYPTNSFGERDIGLSTNQLRTLI